MNTVTSLEKQDPTLTGLDGSAELLIKDLFIERALQLIKKAQTSVLICAYDWRWYVNSPEKAIQQLNSLLYAKSSQGVQVRAILDKPEQAELLRRYKIAAKTFPTTITMHTKAILIDEKTLILGSHNLTERGTAENYEVSLLVKDPTVCLGFYDYFISMWQNYAV